jgi:cation diffusion facilitator family transporter
MSPTDSDFPPPTGHRHRGLRGKLGRVVSHRHDHRPIAASGEEGIRVTKISLIGLGVTAILQAVIVVFTGSVALLSDTIHNVADALTAVPLWIAFAMGRRPPNRRFTHGYHRAEDLAGLIIVVVVFASAVAAGWESIRRLLDPRSIDHAGWVIGAGLIGAIGNEWVARYRIRGGRRIGSAALVADGQHARADALTSLSVMAAGVGSMLGARWADPVVGILVALTIFTMLWRSAGRIFSRLLDAVDPDFVDHALEVTRGIDGVREATGLQLRWHGHRLEAVVTVGVDSDLSVLEGHEIGERVRHGLMHAFPFTVGATVHIDPVGIESSHSLIRHHLEEE